MSQFVEEGNHNFLGNPPYGNPVKTHVAHGNTIKTEYDRVNNFAKVVVADCGVTAAIRLVRGHGFQQVRRNLPKCK